MFKIWTLEFSPSLSHTPSMLSYVESGIIKHLMTKELPEAVICPLDLGSKERQLRNPDLVTTYYVVISGFTVACFVLLGERAMRRVYGNKVGDQFQTSLPHEGNNKHCFFFFFNRTRLQYTLNERECLHTIMNSGRNACYL